MFAVAHTFFAFVLFSVAALSVVPFGVIFFICGFPFPRAAKWITYRIAQCWALLVIKLIGCRITVKGREYVPKTGPVCIASNHCGIFDIILLLAYLGRPFGFVAKIELAFLPVINIWILLLGGQFINRKNIRGSIKTINKGGAKIRSGGAMLIFPEGTRSKGRGLLPFKAGSLKLATESGAPIVPAAIAGSYEVFEQKRLIQKTAASLTFCPPIATKGLPQEERRQVLADRVRSSIASALESVPESAPK
jgi:1-acyl-sn-glycerol-3-phosphate acyltransferase